MIKGIGNDIIEIERIQRVIARYENRFLDRVFTKNEQEYCLKHYDAATRFAGRFAAKEAIVKALGTGLREGLTWLDIEILNDKNGKPCLIPSKNLNEMFHHPHLELSISHCRKYAAAVAIWVMDKDENR